MVVIVRAAKISKLSISRRKRYLGNRTLRRTRRVKMGCRKKKTLERKREMK